MNTSVYTTNNWTTCVYVEEIDNGSVCYRTREELVDSIFEFLALKPHEWLFVVISVIIFLLGIVGNFFVCLVVIKNSKMRTVTNVFLFNLSLSDLLVVLFCLPATVIEDLTETWFFGLTMCKAIKYLQRTSVYVSSLTLTAISIDRCMAVRNPLQARRSRRYVTGTIILIWLIASAASTPDLFLIQLKATFDANLTGLLTHCGVKPGHNLLEQLHIFGVPIVAFFILPIVTMAIAYSRIAARLWHRDPSLRHLNVQGGAGSRDQLMNRRKTARMLIIVVIFYFVCYLPVYVYATIRYFSLLKDVNGPFDMALLLFSHLLLYVNSSLNPVIYNLMSETFRSEFRSLFRCCSPRQNITKESYRSCQRNTMAGSKIHTTEVHHITLTQC